MKFIYSEKAKILKNDQFYLALVGGFLQIFVTFSEYMNFIEFFMKMMFFIGTLHTLLDMYILNSMITFMEFGE